MHTIGLVSEWLAYFDLSGLKLALEERRAEFSWVCVHVIACTRDSAQVRKGGVNYDLLNSVTMCKEHGFSRVFFCQVLLLHLVVTTLYSIE